MKIEPYILERYIENHTSDALLALENMPIDHIVVFLGSIPSNLACSLLCQMDRNRAAACLEKITPELATVLIEQLPIPNSEILLRLINVDLRNDILNQLPEKTSQNIRQILKYPKNTVGAFLNPTVFTLHEEQTVKKALAKIKKEKPHLPQHIFILNRDQLLVGHIELKQLITSDENTSIQTFMNPNPSKISATANISAVTDKATWTESLFEIPVVDNKGVFLGIVSKEALKKHTPKTSSFDNELYQTGAALGELYKIGLASFLRNNPGSTK
ncbi:magnesium transporter MgtE N-terminal domain-containing protein [Saccharicrinis sp. GN24d3]|uniref:magnesium transporter MgtE N-terminal domain-containing protein n=1 Tax=Saccharicrinis sp. GN24d3 TaxID=3458416 RepID=UPI004036F9F9